MANTISLLQKIEQSKMVEFQFTHVDSTKTTDDQDLVTFFLATPLPQIIGSQSVRTGDDADAKAERIAIADVTEIKVMLNELKEEDAVWDVDANIGTYKSNRLTLDVAKKTFDGWLKEIPFAVQGRTFGNEQRQKRTNDLMAAAKAGMAAKNGGAVGAGAAINRASNAPAPVGP